MRIYPEWFIDGPWHGEDKRKKCPHLQGIVRCALPRPFSVRQLLSNELTGGDVQYDIGYDEYTYVPKWVDIFGERICVWISEENAGSVGYSQGHEPDWVRMLGQLILAPHRQDVESPSFNVGGIAQRHRDRWDLEHEVRREVRRELADAQMKIRRLEEELRRARTNQVLHTPTPEAVFVAPNSAKLALKDDVGEEAHVHFDNIVLYFDEGDGTEENPPSWIATAQDPADRPCTGYGTTKKSAIIALLADGIGVYARMIEIGERMK